ncbi:type II CRISPR RNA-guided endonuclease Cas9 [Kiloniella laminariae]|uniref:type II CRISPR RNA-guided endonuclease Cas9 n=1 Tax=Kiloniella laminariae TaxID=454162 RepID=UPI0003767E35|nr:type II CRISPR RNA-guided endonuclease Cas9 [Kiloniella laminariae]
MGGFFPYRLALDGGIASFGWAIYALDRNGEPCDLIDGNVLLFPTAIGASNRREKRSARKTNDRKQLRLKKICEFFASDFQGYNREKAPADVLNTSPFRLRANALDRQVSLAELQRICLHMAKHRGSSAIRMSEDEEIAKEGAAISSAFARTQVQMLERSARTYGELLWRIEKANNRKSGQDTTKIRISKQGNKAGDAYSHYPLRFLIEQEFDKIMLAQSAFHDELTQEKINALKEILFFERETITPKPGYCLYIENERRIPKLSRLFQLKRIYEEVNNLRIDTAEGIRILTFIERDLLIDQLMAGVTLGKKNTKEFLKLKGKDKLYLGKKDTLVIKPYPFDCLLGQDAVLGDRWAEMSEQQQDELLDILATVWDDTRAHIALKKLLNCNDVLARAILAVPLPSGYGAIGASATREIIDVLEANICSATEAAMLAGLKERAIFEGDLLPRLPYYGEILGNHVSFSDNAGSSLPYQEKVFGRIPNMVVHRALIQLRGLVNSIIKKYGPPTQIHLELGRELSMSEQERDDIQKTNENNRKVNDVIRNKLVKNEEKPNRSNLIRYKLWERQKGTCIYSGDNIRITDLFGASTHVDHVLPWSVTCDDGLANKVVCTATANLFKGNNTPHDAFSGAEGYDWAAILRRVDRMIPAMKWRFTADALEKFEDENAGSFSARAMNDNRYIAKLMRFYLSSICRQQDIVVSNGRITSNLNRAWGLDKFFVDHSEIIQEQIGKGKGRSKRADHRHHFVDAVAIGGVTRGMIQKIQTEAGRVEREGAENEFFRRVFAPLEPPVRDLEKRVLALLQQMRPVYKNNHKKQGQLHLETRNGIIDGPDRHGYYINRVRKKITDLPNLEKLNALRIEQTIPDLDEVVKSRERLKAIKTGIENCWEAARAKLLSENQQAIVENNKPKEITDTVVFKVARDLYLSAGGANEYVIYKREKLIVPAHAIVGNRPRFGYVSGNNQRIDFYRNRGTGKLGWQCISHYEAINEDRKDALFIPESKKDVNELIFSLFKDDLVEMDCPIGEGTRDLYKVAKFTKGKMMVVPVLDARMSTDGRQDLGGRGLGFYCDAKARKIKQDKTGKIIWKSSRLQ